MANELNLKGLKVKESTISGSFIKTGGTASQFLKADGSVDNPKETIRAKDFGATGDGITDDTQALKDAVSAIKTGDIKNLFLKKGVYLISETIYLPSNITLYGAGIGQTVIKLKDNSSSTLDLITPIEYTNTATNQTGKYRSMIASEFSDDFYRGQISENITVKNLSIDWNNNPTLDNSINAILIGRCKNSHVYSIELRDSIPSDLENTNSRKHGCSILFAFADDCSIHHSLIGASDYESVTVSFISNRVKVYNNVFNINKPDTYKGQTHALQIDGLGVSEIYTALQSVYGEIMAKSSYVEKNTFLLKKGTGHAITAHGGNGVFIRDNHIKFFNTLGSCWGIKPFDNATNIEISGNIIDARDYPNMQGGATLISTGTSIDGYPISNASIHHNIVKIKNLALYTGTTTYGIQSIIGSYEEKNNENISINHNIVEIDGYENMQHPIFACSGENINVSNNHVTLKNPLETITSSGVAFFISKGGKRISAVLNKVTGTLGRGLVIEDTILGIADLKIDNDFEDCVGLEISTGHTNQSDFQEPAYFNGKQTTLPLSVGKAISVNHAVRLDQTLIKLDKDYTYTVGVGLDFETIEEAISQALQFYPNAEFSVFIIVELGYNIPTTLNYKGLNFSHIIITSNGNRVTATYRPFIFENCLLPTFDNFYMDLSTATSANSIGLLIYQSANLFFKNSKIEGFDTCVWFEQSTSMRIDNNVFMPRKASLGRGIRFMNTSARVKGCQITAGSADCLTGVQLVSASSIAMQENTTTGTFVSGISVEEAFLSLSKNEEIKNNNIYDENNLVVKDGGVVSIKDDVISDFKSSIPSNIVTKFGIIYDNRAGKFVKNLQRTIKDVDVTTDTFSLTNSDHNITLIVDRISATNFDFSAITAEGFQVFVRPKGGDVVCKYATPYTLNGGTTDLTFSTVFLIERDASTNNFFIDG